MQPFQRRSDLASTVLHGKPKRSAYPPFTRQLLTAVKVGRRMARVARGQARSAA
jgi:hypothetical protein